MSDRIKKLMDSRERSIDKLRAELDELELDGDLMDSVVGQQPVKSRRARLKKLADEYDELETLYKNPTLPIKED